MSPFEYSRPTSLPDVLLRLRTVEDSRPLAGGMTLLPTMKQRLATPTELVDLDALDELKGIALRDGQIVVGALTTHADVAECDIVRAHLPGLGELANVIGDVQVRNRGTIGGSIANNDPAADYPAALVALNATVVTTEREIAAEQFFTGMFETALAPTELVTHVRFPIVRACAYAKFPHPISRFAMTGVFIADTDGGYRVAVTGAGPVVFRARVTEDALNTTPTAEAARAARIKPEGLNTDMHAGADYRVQLVSVMAERAMSKILAQRTA